MFRGVIYFAGPKARWARRMDDSETIAQIETPWLWLTRMYIRSTFERLDTTRCGYAILRDGECVESYIPPLEGIA